LTLSNSLFTLLQQPLVAASRFLPRHRVHDSRRIEV
jgi:hypothetical protein